MDVREKDGPVASRTRPEQRLHVSCLGANLRPFSSGRCSSRLSHTGQGRTLAQFKYDETQTVLKTALALAGVAQWVACRPAN